MKNFARLARFAWPYRVRFALSLGCAVMVAMLWFTNLASVYPLLKILFYSQNCKIWCAEQIAQYDASIEVKQARLDAMDEVEKFASQGEVGIKAIRELGNAAKSQRALTDQKLDELKAEYEDLELKPLDKGRSLDKAKLPQIPPRKGCGRGEDRGAFPGQGASRQRP